LFSVLSEPDTDGDGLPNSWEISQGLNPNVNDAALDADKDGHSNAAEYALGTAANNAQSNFRASFTRNAILGDFNFTWPAVAGRVYRIQFSSDLQHWVDFPDTTTLATTSGSKEVRVVIPPEEVDIRAFFRVTLALP
jgi:hypothetical protein